MSEELFNKIRVMKPDDAFKWVQDNQDLIGSLDEKTKAMLYRKLEKVDDEITPHDEWLLKTPADKLYTSDITEEVDEQNLVRDKKPTIEQLEAILGSKEKVEIDISPDGRIRPRESVQKIERFVCNRFPSKWILVGNKEIRFQGGEFRTSDPELIEAIVNDPHFGLWILADNKELMKRRKRFR